MPVTLYALPPSANSGCARFFLEASGIEYTEENVYGKTRSPEYVAKFPTNLAPAISNGDVNIGENMAIMRYLVKVFPDKAGKFVPEDPVAAATQDMIVDYVSSFYPLIAKAMYPTVGFPLYAGDVSSMESTKDKTEESQKAAASALETMIKDKFVGVYLKDKKFLGSDTVTLADFRMAPLFYFAKVAVKMPEEIETYLKNLDEATGGALTKSNEAVIGFTSPKWV